MVFSIQPPLTIAQVLAWADRHHARTGQWPRCRTGPVHEVAGLTWFTIDDALRQGYRGLPGGSSLARLLKDRRGVRNHMQSTPLSEERILAWADAHHARTGRWPTARSGPVQDAPGETWQAIQQALRHGQRSLPGGSSLPKLLARERRRRNRGALADLNIEQILAWAEGYRGRHSRWPDNQSGEIPDSGGETWMAIERALNRAARGLPVPYTLHQLIVLYDNVKLREGREVPLSDGRTWGGTAIQVTARILKRRAANAPDPASKPP
jgi:hypothetical protein